MQSEKPFYLSTTFWGIALSALGMAAQRLGLAQLAAFLASPETVSNAMELAGLIVAGYGRYTATTMIGPVTGSKS